MVYLYIGDSLRKWHNYWIRLGILYREGTRIAMKPTVYVVVDIAKGRTLGVYPTHDDAWRSRDSVNEVVMTYDGMPDDACVRLYDSFTADNTDVETFAAKHKMRSVFAIECLARGMELKMGGQ